MYVNQTYCGGHFTTHTNIESLRCTPKTNMMLYVNYISFFFKWEKNKLLVPCASKHLLDTY